MNIHVVQSEKEAKAVASLARRVFGPFIALFVQSSPKWAFYATNEQSEMIGGVMLKRLTSDSAVVDFIFVGSAGRGQGVGPALLDAALSSMSESGCTTQLAYIRDDNTPSWNMFAERGFHLPSIFKAYFGYGIRAFLDTIPVLFANHGYSLWVRTLQHPKPVTSPKPGVGIAAIFVLALLTTGIMGLGLGWDAWLPYAVPLVLGVTLMRLVLTWPFARRYGPVRFQVPHGGVPLSLGLAWLGVWWPVLGQWVPREAIWHESHFRSASGQASLVGWLVTISALAATYLAPDQGMAENWRASLVPMLFYQAIPIGPFEGLDGFRVLKWSKPAFILGAVVSAALFVYGVVWG